MWNVSFDLETNQTVIFIKTPYQNDFLRVENQLFQLHIWTAGQNLVRRSFYGTLITNRDP